MNQHAQLRRVPTNVRPERNHQANVSPSLELRWFEFDRGAVLRQIDQVRGTISQNAIDLGMVAVEGVFEKPLADELMRTSRSLHLLAQELAALRGQVVRSNGYPKPTRNGHRKVTAS